MDCPHGMPSRAACVTCMEDGPVAEPAVWHRIGDAFTARFDGDCRGCVGGPIVAGITRIVRWDRYADETDLDRETVYLHEACAP